MSEMRLNLTNVEMLKLAYHFIADVKSRRMIMFLSEEDTKAKEVIPKCDYNLDTAMKEIDGLHKLIPEFLCDGYRVTIALKNDMDMKTCLENATELLEGLSRASRRWIKDVSEWLSEDKISGFKTQLFETTICGLETFDNEVEGIILGIKSQFNVMDAVGEGYDRFYEYSEIAGLG